jgi:hypothetical protein
MFSILSYIVSSLLFCSVNCDIERKLSVQLNPYCNLENNCDGITVVYIKSQAENDTVHYIWDFTGIPGIIIAKTDINSSMIIDWNKFMENTEQSISFNSTPHYIFSAMISKIYLFNDPNDKANINDESVKDIISLKPHFQLKWFRENLTQFENHVMLQMNAQILGKSKDSSIRMKVSELNNLATRN